jgi:hypothetical protein
MVMREEVASAVAKGDAVERRAAAQEHEQVPVRTDCQGMCWIGGWNGSWRRNGHSACQLA